jgi:hypothetical protein
LGVRPSDALFFSYYTESGAPGDSPVNTQLPDLSQVTQDDFWYVAQAISDYDGDGECRGFETYPGNVMIVTMKDENGDGERAEFCPQN